MLKSPACDSTDDNLSSKSLTCDSKSAFCAANLAAFDSALPIESLSVCNSAACFFAFSSSAFLASSAALAAASAASEACLLAASAASAASLASSASLAFLSSFNYDINYK